MIVSNLINYLLQKVIKIKNFTKIIFYILYFYISIISNGNSQNENANTGAQDGNTNAQNANTGAQDRNVENPPIIDEGNETDSDDELVQNPVIKPRLTRVPLRGAIGRGRGRNRRGRRGTGGRGEIARRINTDPRFRNRRLIEAPVNTQGLLEKVKAACYLSMKEYWNVPMQTGMIATILDPRLKKLNFIRNEATKHETIGKLYALYSDEKDESELDRKSVV